MSNEQKRNIIITTHKSIQMENSERENNEIKRVAAYCRVSTLLEEQGLSYESQCAYYESLIGNTPDMELVGVYGDQGFSGLHAKNRPEFQRMIEDCLEGKIDLIMVKSISRFSRNTLECQYYVDLLKEHGLFFGTSICYTSQNYETVTSDEFLDMLISHGVRFTWYFHYMPVGNDASTELLLTPEQRKYMYHRVREIRGMTGGKPIFAIDFQNDGEFAGGCVAGGRIYCHINAAGDVEPCVFIHYSGANIREKSFLECLQQPLFLEYRKGQPFNGNHLRPCPMLENPELLPEMVKRSGAHSTDLEAPESAEHLCDKCKAYAACWQPTAEQLWDEDHKA